MRKLCSSRSFNRCWFHNALCGLGLISPLVSRASCYYRLAFCTTGSLISNLWTGSLFWDGVKKSRGEGRKRVLSFSSRFFHPFPPQTKSLFTGYMISYGLTALVELYSTDNEVACVARGVERGRGRGNLGARESVWGARGRKERKKGKVPLLPPPSRVVSRPNSLPLPFRTPATRRLITRRIRVLLKDGIEQWKKRCGNIFSANSTQKYIDVLNDMVRDYN